MAKLRLETADAHASIERSPPMRAILSSDYSLLDYRSLLQRMKEFYSPFEAEVFDKLSPHLATKLEHRRKAHLLEADLCAIGDITNPVKAAPIPDFDSDEMRMGGIYVLEGATLGGALIRKHLAAHFGGEIASSLSFYSGYGKRAAREWRAFGALLGSLFDCAGEARQSQVIAGANATFGALENWLIASGDPLPRGATSARTA